MDILAILMIVALFICLNVVIFVYLVIAGASRLNEEEDEENKESEAHDDEVDNSHPTITIVVDEKNKKP